MGELLALRWRDVDFELQAVRVRAGSTHRQLDTPKNRTGRTVPMIDPVAAASWLTSAGGGTSPARTTSSSPASPAITSTTRRSGDGYKRARDSYEDHLEDCFVLGL